MLDIHFDKDDDGVASRVADLEAALDEIAGWLPDEEGEHGTDTSWARAKLVVTEVDGKTFVTFPSIQEATFEEPSRSITWRLEPNDCSHPLESEAQKLAGRCLLCDPEAVEKARSRREAARLKYLPLEYPTEVVKVDPDKMECIARAEDLTPIGWQVYHEDDTSAFVDKEIFESLDAVLAWIDKGSDEGPHSARPDSGFAVYMVLNKAGEACLQARDIARSVKVPVTMAEDGVKSPPNKWVAR